MPSKTFLYSFGVDKQMTRMVYILTKNEKKLPIIKGIVSRKFYMLLLISLDRLKQNLPRSL
jgi:hypothetical protein